MIHHCVLLVKTEKFDEKYLNLFFFLKNFPGEKGETQ
jgi:hypothetical protein